MIFVVVFFFCKQKTAYDMRISDWSSDVCSSDLRRRPDRTLDVLCEIDADIICLQEADRRFGGRGQVLTPHLLADHSPWKAVPFGTRAASMGWHGNAILVRKEADILDCEPIHLPALEPRGAVMADIGLDGQTVRLIGMHLALSGLWRRRQAAALIAPRSEGR